MSTLNSMIARLQSLNVNQVSVEAMEETSDARIEENRRQLGDGKRADGSDILPSYSNLTIQIKRLKGQETRFVTLRDTGDFWAAIKSSVRGNSIVTESTDSKTEKLRKKYETSKGGLFGLSKDYKAEYIKQDLRPVFNKKMHEATGL